MKAEITKMIKRHFYNVHGTPEKSASEIESHVFEFVEWCIINTYHTPLGYGILDESIEELTIEQLYDLWWNNVKNKSVITTVDLDAIDNKFADK